MAEVITTTQRDTDSTALRLLALFGFLIAPVALVSGVWVITVGKADGREALLSII